MSGKAFGYYCCCCGRRYQRLPNVEPLRCSCGMSACLGPYRREPRRVSCPHVGCDWTGWQDGVEDGLRLHLVARHRGQAGLDVPGQLLLEGPVLAVAVDPPVARPPARGRAWRSIPAGLAPAAVALLDAALLREQELAAAARELQLADWQIVHVDGDSVSAWQALSAVGLRKLEAVGDEVDKLR